MKELEDYTWFPKYLRQYQASYIGLVVHALKLYQPLIANIKTIPNNKNWVDLCSGSSIATKQLNTCIKSNLNFTDKFPLNETIDKLDVLKGNFEKNKLYTMFNSWHHFNYAEQAIILNKLIQSKSSFLIAEILQPKFSTFLKVIFASTLMQYLLCPFVKPFSLKNLLLVYIIPVHIFTVLYDGLISTFKANNKIRFKNFETTFTNNEYSVNFKIIKTGYLNQLYILEGKVVTV